MRNSIRKIVRKLLDLENSKIVWIYFFLFWFGLLAVTGTFFSGFHFTDDHGIIRTQKDLAGTTITNEANVFWVELTAPKIRFRPFFQMQRRLCIALFGSYFPAWFVYYAFFAVFTSFFLYLFMKKNGFTGLESVLFAFLTVLGEQAAIWWKLGSNETPGMLMLSIALVFMVTSTRAKNPKKKILHESFFILFVILASWSKESFVLLIPALLTWKVYLTYLKDSPETTLSYKALKPAILKNIIPIVILFIVCAFDLMIIYNVVSKTTIVYAGYDGFSIGKYFLTLKQFFFSLYGLALGIQVIVLLIYARRKLNKLLFPLMIFAMIIDPQILLYMKSGIMERYLLPALLGMTFIMIVFLRHIRKYSKINAPSDETGAGKCLFSSSWFCSRSKAEIIIILVLVVILLQQLRVTRYTAAGFAFDGKQTNGWLHSIDANTQKDDLILVITHPVRYWEHTLSFKTYMSYKLERQNTWFATPDPGPPAIGLIKEVNADYLKRYPTIDVGKMEHHSFKAVVLFPGLEKRFLAYHTGFDPKQYIRYTNKGGFVSYYKKCPTLDSNIPKQQPTARRANGDPRTHGAAGHRRQN